LELYRSGKPLRHPKADPQALRQPKGGHDPAATPKGAGTSAAKAAHESWSFIAAVNRCATQRSVLKSQW